MINLDRYSELFKLTRSLLFLLPMSLSDIGPGVYLLQQRGKTNMA